MKTTSIERLYDKYVDKDFSFGQDNLNPQRSMIYDKIDDIDRRVQAVADNIIKRKLAQAKETKSFDISNGEGNLSTSNSPVSRALKSSTGTDGNSYIEPLPEFLITAALKNQGDIDQLQEPYALDCDYSDFLYNRESDADEDDGSGDDSSSSSSSLTITSASGSSSDSDEEDCAQIELEYLKVILAIVKILKIVRKIYDLIFSLINPLIEMIKLAIDCWVSPPSASLLAQKLVSLLTSIVTMLVSQIIQIIWNLLNMDCITNTTLDLINQIKNTLNDLTDAVGLFTPNGLGLYSDLDKLANQFDQFSAELEAKQAEWEALKDEDWWGDFKEPFKDFGSTIGQAALDGVTSSAAFSAFNSVKSAGTSLASSAKELGSTCSSFTSQWSEATAEYTEKVNKAREAESMQAEAETTETIASKAPNLAFAEIESKEDDK